MDEEGAHLHETVSAFAAFVEALPASAFRPATWGPREVLSHLVFWHETYVRLVSGLLAGRRSRSLRGSFNELNHLAVARFAARPVSELRRRLLRAQARLERLTPEARGRGLRVAVKASVTPRPIDELLARVEGHVRAHHTALRRELARAA